MMENINFYKQRMGFDIMGKTYVMGKSHILKNYTNLLRSKDTERIRRELPRIEDFRKELIAGFNRWSDMESELWHALGDASDNSYGKHWGLYFDLVRLPSNGGQGIVYVNTPHSFKESIDWIVSANGSPSSRFKLKDSAKAYKIWRNVKEYNPKAEFHSVRDILNYKKFEGLQFLIMPSVSIKGKRDSISLQNWFGDNSKFLTGREVRNPYWDT